MTLEEYIQSKYSPLATKGYLNRVSHFKASVEHHEEASYQDVLNYIGELRRQGKHPKTLHNYLFTTKIYFSYLVETGQRNDHPCKYLNLKDPMDKQVKLEGLYTQEQLEEFYRSWQSHSPKNQVRDKLILSLLIYQALTTREITQLCLSDVNLADATIRIPPSGKNKKRELSLQACQIRLLMQHMETVSTAHLLSNRYGTVLTPPAISKIINQYQEKKDWLIPLRIRQSVIANLLKENKDVRVVQEFAGHRRTTSTENYKQTGLDELKTAIESLHPLQ